MRLYDTARREVVPFEPGPVVTLYTCGITPYDSAHLGHAATYLAFDVLQRRLRDIGHDTRCVRNVTDVDDDILRKSRELGVHYLDLAVEELARFDSSMSALGLLPAWSEPRATSAIAEILSLVDAVLQGGHAYRAGGAVYFDVSSFGSFGQLSHLGREAMLALSAANAVAILTTRTRTIRSTSCSGNLPRPTNPPGSRVGDREGRVGMSNALRWRCESSERPSTSTVAGAISSSLTTSARLPSPKQSPANHLHATGCTPEWSASTARRCRSPWGTWCS